MRKVYLEKDTMDQISEKSGVSEESKISLTSYVSPTYNNAKVIFKSKTN